MAARLLVFYLGVPVLFSTYLTFSSGPLLEDPGYLQTFAFYLSHSLPPWLLTALMTRLCMLLLAPWRPGLVPLTTLGSVASCLVSVPYVAWLSNAYDWSAYAIMRPPMSEDLYVLVSLVKATVIWIFVNLIFDRYFGLPRYRYGPRPQAHGSQAGHFGPGTLAATTAGADFAPAGLPPACGEDGSTMAAADDATPANFVPPFLARLDKPVELDQVLALKSEQHYLQVIAGSRRQLVLYRLSDAVRELPPGRGVQVHRSWWVAHAAMKRVSSRGRRMTLELTDGTSVPVSLPHQQLVRQLLEAR